MSHLSWTLSLFHLCIMPQIIPPRIPIIRIHIQILHRTPHTRLNPHQPIPENSKENTWITSGCHRNIYITAAHVKLPNTGHDHLLTVPLESFTTPFCIANFAIPCITRANTYKFISHQLRTDGGSVPVVRRQSRCQRCNILRRGRRGRNRVVLHGLLGRIFGGTLVFCILWQRHQDYGRVGTLIWRFRRIWRSVSTRQSWLIEVGRVRSWTEKECHD